MDSNQFATATLVDALRSGADLHSTRGYTDHHCEGTERSSFESDCQSCDVGGDDASNQWGKVQECNLSKPSEGLYEAFVSSVSRKLNKLVSSRAIPIRQVPQKKDASISSHFQSNLHSGMPRSESLESTNTVCDSDPSLPNLIVHSEHHAQKGGNAKKGKNVIAVFPGSVPSERSEQWGKHALGAMKKREAPECKPSRTLSSECFDGNGGSSQSHLQGHWSTNDLQVDDDMEDVAYVGEDMQSASCQFAQRSCARKEEEQPVPAFSINGHGMIRSAGVRHQASDVPARKKHRTFQDDVTSEADSEISAMSDDELSILDGKSPRSVIAKLEEFQKMAILKGLAEEDHRVALYVDRYLKLLQRMLPNPPSMPSREVLEAELAVANRCMSQQLLPGGIPYIPVQSGDTLLPLAVQCGIPVIAVALGASYVQRLIAVHAPLREAAKAAGWIRTAVTSCQKDAARKMLRVKSSDYLPMWQDDVAPLDDAPRDGIYADTTMVFRSLPHATEEPALSSPDVKGPIEHSSRSLILVYATCIYIASKVVDRPQYRGLLTAMLSAIIGQQVTSKEAVSLESMCLHRLEFRLGPNFD